jgi:hypothetical protein
VSFGEDGDDGLADDVLVPTMILPISASRVSTFWRKLFARSSMDMSG